MILLKKKKEKKKEKELVYRELYVTLAYQMEIFAHDRVVEESPAGAT
jgi:hypothetical protein